MVEISNIPDPVSVSITYAKNQVALSAFLKAFHLKDIKAVEFTKQTQLLRLVPQLSQLQNLWGFLLGKTLARFQAPEGFFYQQLIASEFLLAEMEMIDVALSRLEGFVNKNQEAAGTSDDAAKLITFLKQRKYELEIRQYIRSRLYQFIQV